MFYACNTAFTHEQAIFNMQRLTKHRGDSHVALYLRVPAFKITCGVKDAKRESSHRQTLYSVQILHKHANTIFKTCKHYINIANTACFECSVCMF